jgi:DNA-binding transcriptional LysR family regulator
MAHELALHELPFVVPPVQVHALWHRKRQQDSPHQWLRTQLQQVARQAFDGNMTTTAMTTTATPASDIAT